MMRNKIISIVGLGFFCAVSTYGCEICGIDHEEGQCPYKYNEKIFGESCEKLERDKIEPKKIRKADLEENCKVFSTMLYMKYYAGNIVEKIKCDSTDSDFEEKLECEKERIYDYLLAKCDCLLKEAEALCSMMQTLDKEQIYDLYETVVEARRLEEQRIAAEAELKRQQAEAERIRLEEEAKKPKGFTGQQIMDRTRILVQHSPKKVVRIQTMVRFKKIQPGNIYMNKSQLHDFFHPAFEELMNDEK